MLSSFIFRVLNLYVKSFYNLTTPSFSTALFDEQDVTDLVKEMEVMKLMEPHVHLIRLYGTCTQSGEFTSGDANIP